MKKILFVILTICSCLLIVFSSFIFADKLSVAQNAKQSIEDSIEMGMEQEEDLNDPTTFVGQMKIKYDDAALLAAFSGGSIVIAIAMEVICIFIVFSKKDINAAWKEYKEKRAQSRVEKAAANKQAEIEDKQKRLKQLQAELDELKKDS